MRVNPQVVSSLSQSVMKRVIGKYFTALSIKYLPFDRRITILAHIFNCSEQNIRNLSAFSIISIPVTGLLRDFGTSRRFAHDYTVHTED